MCGLGLCGELRFDSSLPDLAALALMSARLARRGADMSLLVGLLAFRCYSSVAHAGPREFTLRGPGGAS